MKTPKSTPTNRPSLLAAWLATLLLVHTASGNAMNPEEALKRYQSLLERSKAIAPTTGREQVVAVLGEPESKQVGGKANPWSVKDRTPYREQWHYLHFTDDNQSMFLTVFFDSEQGTGVSTNRVTREDVLKRPKQVDFGTVIAVTKLNENDRCLDSVVRFDHGIAAGLILMDYTKVKGDPAVGSRIRVEHHGPRNVYDFTHTGSWSLISVEFTPGK